MPRQHGYFVLIPAFIPVDKKNLQNQIDTGRVLLEAAQTQDLATITALPGIRYHAQRGRGGAVKEIHQRWGSVEIETEIGEAAGEGNAEQTYFERTGELEPGTLGGAEMSGSDELDAADQTTDDPEPTIGRRSRARAA
jgi:hypothetical protein